MQERGEEQDIICIAMIVEVEMVLGTEVKAELFPAVQPLVSCNIEEA